MGESQRVILLTAVAMGHREDSIRQKNTPLVSRPNWAKLSFVVAEETNLNPCPVLFRVLALTLMVAEDSKKSPENRFIGSLNPIRLRATPLHCMSIDSMTALTTLPMG